jgi:hypothetical protein
MRTSALFICTRSVSTLDTEPPSDADAEDGQNEVDIANTTSGGKKPRVTLS